MSAIFGTAGTNTALGDKIRYDYVEPVLIIVGPSKAEFIVLERDLCRTDFLLDLCSSKRAGKSETVITLPDIDPRVFKIYINFCIEGWIYIGPKISTMEGGYYGNDYDNNTPRIKSDADIELLVGAYAFGHKIEDSEFCEKVVKRVRHILDSTDNLPFIAHAEAFWRRVPSTSKTGMLLVEYTATDLDAGIPDDALESYSPAFLLEVAKAVMRNKGSLPGRRGPRNQVSGFYDDETDEE